MAAAKLPVGDTNQALQTWENTVAGEEVHTEAVTLTDSSGVERNAANPQPVSDASLNGKFTSLDAGGRQPVTTHDSTGLDVLAELVFFAGAEIVLGSGQDGAVAFENPSDSGKLAVILSLTVEHSEVDSLDVVFFEDPTVTGGSVLTPSNAHFGSAATSDMVVTSGQGILSEGTQLDAHMRTSRNYVRTVNGPFIIPAGVTVGLQTQAPGGLSGGTDLSVNVIYKEESV